MKAQLTALECAISARNALKRVNEAIDAATKRLAELNKLEDKTTRIVGAIETIQAAMRTADNAHKVARRVALAALAIDPKSTVELGEVELAALAYGLEDEKR